MKGREGGGKKRRKIREDERVKGGEKEDREKKGKREC